MFFALQKNKVLMPNVENNLDKKIKIFKNK
jgi:hypothetical protein